MSINRTLDITKLVHHWTEEEKTKWCGEGEWVNEPDEIEFEYLGYSARIIRVLVKEPYAKEEAYFGGHLCGYVKIPQDHSWWKNNFYHHEVDIDCHGGLTYNDCENGHWIGFDCAHSGDYVPTSELFRKISGINTLFPPPNGFENCSIFNPVYRNGEFCIEQCKHIIEKLIEAKSNAVDPRRS